MLFCSATTASTVATVAAARISRTMMSRRLRVGFMGMAVSRRRSVGRRKGHGVAFLTGALTRQACSKFTKDTTTAQARRDGVGNQHDEEQRVGLPHVGGVAKKQKKGLQRVHRAASLSAIWRTQSLPLSRSSRSVRARRNRLAT